MDAFFNSTLVLKLLALGAIFSPVYFVFCLHKIIKLGDRSTKNMATMIAYIAVPALLLVFVFNGQQRIYIGIYSILLAFIVAMVLFIPPLFKKKATGFAAEIKKQIKGFNHMQLALFCALNCEKMLPGYIAFSRKEKWGNPDFFKSVLKEIYEQLANDNKKIDYDSLERQLNENFADLKRFESAITTYAYDACCAFDSLIHFSKTKDKGSVYHNSDWCLSSVDTFVQDRMDVNFVEYAALEELEKKVAEDEYMKREKARQLDLINKIREINILDAGAIQNIRNYNNRSAAIVDYESLV